MRGNLASLGSYAGLLVLLIAPVALALDSGQPLIAVLFEPLVIAWVLVSILPSNRRVEMRSSRLVGKMARRRGLAMLEIKWLLEAQEPAPV